MRLFLCLLLFGCASAGAPEVGGHGGDAGFTHPTDSSGHPVDTFVNTIDAPPGQQTKTLSETTSNTLRPVTSIACPAATVGTSANIYYRVFDLATFGITSDFHVTQVSFQVEDCETAGGNGTNVAVRVGTYNGTPGNTLTVANMTVLASNANVTVPEIVEDVTAMTTPGGLVNAPINATINAGMKVLVEVDVPDGDLDHFFYPGANTGGQSAKGYVSSPSCTPPGTTPTDIGTVVMPATEIDLLLTVTGTY
jgi:hypothetical protein